MEYLYGYSVAADLQPECRYDEVARALGGHGELVSKPDELRPALERAFACGKPALVNVLTDPEVVYPRRANLAERSSVTKKPPASCRRFPKRPHQDAGVRAMKGPCGPDGGKRRYDAASPEPMYRVKTMRVNRTASPTQRRDHRPLPVPWEGEMDNPSRSNVYPFGPL